MASIRETPAGWRAQVFVRGLRDSRCFRTRREAAAWAAVRETELRAVADRPVAERVTLAEAMRRYRDEVSPTKRGARWERVRIDAMLRAALPLDTPIARVTPEQIAAWRDGRLGVVSAGTVLRDFSLLSAIFEHARREWRLLPTNPVADVRKPRAPDHRQTVLTRAQIRALLQAMGYGPRRPVRSVNQAVAVAMLVALRTGMRAGELCGLEWTRVHDAHCVLPVTKTVPREVPLTQKAKRLIGKMAGFDPVRVFGIKPQSLDALFRKARQRAGLNGIVFHDTRHTAATWLAPGLHVLDMCRMFGWANPKQAMTYYNPSAAEIAKRLG